MKNSSNSVKAKKTVTMLLIIVCVVVLAVSAYQLISYYLAGAQAERDFEELLPPEIADTEDGEPLTFEEMLAYYQGLKEQNGDFAGWLRIPGMNVDYPVMQTVRDPEFYLHRNFNKEYSGAGALFASELSDVLRPTDLTIIYGHNMKNGAMFGRIDKFYNGQYFSAHSDIIFDTLQNRNEYKVFCIFPTTVDTGDDTEFKYYNYADFKDAAEFDAFIAKCRERAVAASGDVTPVFGDKLLLLSTCDDNNADGNKRVCLLAVRVSPARGELAAG